MRWLCVILLVVAWSLSAEVRTVTAYCGCRNCTQGLGVTASGTIPKQGRTVAASWLPLGTKVFIAGVGTRIVEDKTHPRYGNRVDVYFHRHSDAKKFGKKKLKIVCK